MRRPSIRFAAGMAVVALAVIGSPRVVSAHIDPDPKEAPAGSEQSVGFTVEHGCDGSPTIGFDMRLPDGVTNAVPEPPDGWEANVRRRVVTFTGGPLPADVEGTFRVRMVLPMSPGATIYFPFVQRCEQGEIRWIDVPSDGSGTELDEPAPAMNLTEPLPTTTPTSPPTTPPPTTAPATTTTEAATTTTEPAATTPPASTTASTPVPTSSTPPTVAPASTTPVTDPDENEDDSGSGPALFVAIAVAVAAITGVAIWLVRRRRA
jgi:uncharacterized protein YcnI